MATDMKALLRRMADEIEQAETSESLEERFKRLEARAEAGGTVTAAQLLEALRSASDEELEELHGTVLGRLVQEVEEEREARANGGTGEGEGEGDKGKGKSKSKGKGKRTRPGRRQGSAYGWDIDAETGEVVPLGVARVWNEPDEPDEVELPPLAEADEDEPDEDGGDE